MSQAKRLEPRSLIGGKYRLIRRIAFGGMGEVWVAHNETTGAAVALKTFRGDAASEETRARFRHEAHLGATLSHRGIVRVFDLIEERDGILLLVMELLHGETLQRHLEARGAIPAREAIGIAVSVLSALAYAHDSSIVHRDVTPANVFLAIDPDGHVTPKLVDFGIAKLASSGIKTLDGRVLGTPQYMAPEQIRGQRELDGRTDLFSVGVILYEMLTGVCPFAASSPASSLAAVLETVVDPDPRIDPRVWVELRRALAKQPYERHRSAHEMAAGLLAAAGESEESATGALRRARPSSNDADAVDGVSAAHPTRTEGGHSVGRVPAAAFPMRRGALRWIGGALLACLALASTIAVRRSGNHSPVSASFTAPPSIPLALSPTLASPAGLAPSSVTASTVEVQGDAATSPKAAPRPRHVKAVGTTPGF